MRSTVHQISVVEATTTSAIKETKKKKKTNDSSCPFPMHAGSFVSLSCICTVQSYKKGCSRASDLLKCAIISAAINTGMSIIVHAAITVLNLFFSRTIQPCRYYYLSGCHYPRMHSKRVERVFSCRRQCSLFFLDNFYLRTP